VFGWPAALAGTIGCAVAMVKINETYAIVAMLIAGAVYVSLRGRATGTWGDAKRGYIFARTRENLLLLEHMTPDPKNWRPVLAVVTEDAERDRQLLECASWIESRRGLLSVLEVKTAPDETVEDRLDLRHRRMAEIQEQLRGRKITAFADSVVVPESSDRLDAILQAYSIGSLRPNTIMVSAPPPSQVERRARLTRTLRTVAAFGLNVIVYKGARLEGVGRNRIDLWWHGQHNGSLMALISYLTSGHPQWQNVKIRMLRVVKSGQEHLEAEQSLRELMMAARINVEIDIVLSQRPVSELIAERSATADLVLLGLRQQDLYDFNGYLADRDPLLAKLPPTLLVLSNGEADLLA
jgi:hypothetical protein